MTHMALKMNKKKEGIWHLKKRGGERGGLRERSLLPIKWGVYANMAVRYGTRLGDLKESWFILFSN